MVSFSAFLSFFSLLPSCIILAYGLPKLNPKIFTTDNGPETNWNDMLTWVLWLYSGVINFSSIAREVKDPARSYMSACGVLIGVDLLLVNFTPLWVSLSIDPNRRNYEAGHFSDVADMVAGAWLTYLLTFGAQVRPQEKNIWIV
jgi:amino acid transporter